MELRGGGSSSQLRLHGQRAGVVRGQTDDGGDDDASVRARLAKRNQIHTENHFPTLLGRNNVVGGSRHAVRHAANYKDTSLKSLLSKLATKSNGLSKTSTRAQIVSKLSTKSSTVSKIMTRAGPGDDVPVYADAHAGGITITFEVDKKEKKRRDKIQAMGLSNGFTTTNSGSHKIDVVFDTVPRDNDAIAQMGMGTQGILSTWAKYGFEEDPDTKKLREAQKQNLDEYGYNKFVDLLQKYIMEQIRKFRLEHGESTRMPPLEITIKKTKEGLFEEGPITYVTPEDEIYHAYEQFSTAIIAAAPSLYEEKLHYATNAIVKSTQSAIMSATNTKLTERPISRTVIMPVDQFLSDPYKVTGIDDLRSFFIKYCVEYLCNQKNVSEEDYKTDSIFGGDVYDAIVNRNSDHRYMIGLQFRGKNVPAITDLKKGLRMNDKNNGKIRFYRGDDGKNDLIGVVVVGENAKLSSTDYGDYKEETPHLLLAAACRHHMSEEADRLGLQSSKYDEINKANQGTFKELVARTITEAKMKFLDAAQEQEMDRAIEEAEAKSEDIKAYIDSLKHGGRLSYGGKADLVETIQDGNIIELALKYKTRVMKQRSIESNRDEVYDIINSKSDPLLQIYLANAADGAPYRVRDQYPQRYKEALETILENSYRGSLSALTGPLEKQISEFKVPEDVRGVDLSQFTWHQVYLIAVNMGAYKAIENDNFVNTATKEELIKMIQSKIASRDPGVEPAEAVATSPVANIVDFPPLSAPKKSGSNLITVKTYLETPGNSLEKGQKLKWEWPQGTHPNEKRTSANAIVLDTTPSDDGTITVEDQSKEKHVSSEELYIINDQKDGRQTNYSRSIAKIKSTETKAQKAQKRRKKRSSTDSRPTTTTITPVTAPRQPSVSSESSEVANTSGEEGDITSNSPILSSLGAAPAPKLRKPLLKKPVKPKQLNKKEFTEIFNLYKANFSKEEKNNFDESLKPAEGEERVAKFMEVIQNNEALEALYTKKMEAKLAEYEKTLAEVTQKQEEQEREKARLAQAEREAKKAATAKAKAAKEAQAKVDRQAKAAAKTDFAKKRDDTIAATLTDENGKYRDKLIRGDYYNKEFMIEQLEVVDIYLNDDDRKLLDGDGMGFIKKYILDDDVGELVKVAMERIVDFEKFFFEDEEQTVAAGQTKLYYQLMGKYRYLKYAQLLDWYGRPPVLTSDNVIKMYGNDEPESWVKLFTTCDTLFDDISIAGKDHYEQLSRMNPSDRDEFAIEQYQDLFMNSLLAGDGLKAGKDLTKALSAGDDQVQAETDYMNALRFQVITPELINDDLTKSTFTGADLGKATGYDPTPNERRLFLLGRQIKNQSTAVLVHLLQMPISTDEIKGLARAHSPNPLTEEEIANSLGGNAVIDVADGLGLSPLQWHVAFVVNPNLKATTTADGRPITLKENDWRGMEQRDKEAYEGYRSRGIAIPAELEHRISFYNVRNAADEILKTIINPYIKETTSQDKAYNVSNLDVEDIRALHTLVLSNGSLESPVAAVIEYYRLSRDRDRMYGSITFEDDEQPSEPPEPASKAQSPNTLTKPKKNRRKQSNPKRKVLAGSATEQPEEPEATPALTAAVASLTADEVAESRAEPAVDITTLDIRTSPGTDPSSSVASDAGSSTPPYYPISPSYDANPFATLIRDLPLSPIAHSPRHTLPLTWFDDETLREATVIQQSINIEAWIRETSLKSAAAHFNLDPEVAIQMYHYDTESDANSDLRNNLRVRIQSLSPGLDDTELTKELENAYVALFGPGNICKMD